MDAPGRFKVRLCGYWIEDDAFKALMVKAQGDPEFDGLPFEMEPSR
jgi:hypothetical protein